MPSPPAASRPFIQTNFHVLEGCFELDAADHGVSGVVEDEGATVSEVDFPGFPRGAATLVPEFGRVSRGFVLVS